MILTSHLIMNISRHGLVIMYSVISGVRNLYLITVIGMSIRTNLSIALTPPILTLTLTLTLTLNACLVDLLPLWQWIINLTHTPLPYPLISTTPRGSSTHTAPPAKSTASQAQITAEHPSQTSRPPTPNLRLSALRLSTGLS